MSYAGSDKIGKIREGTGYIKRIYHGSTMVFKYTNPVIYHIDDSTSISKVTRDVEYGASCRSAYTAGTPSGWGSEWVFVGWKTNKTADDDILTSSDTEDKMGHSTVNLYAVFKKEFKLSYAAGGGTGSMTPQTITQYYNNGNYSVGDANGVTFTLKANGFSRENYTFDGWSISSTTKKAGDSITLSGDATATALWKANTKTLTYGYTIVNNEVIYDPLFNWTGSSHSEYSDEIEIDMTNVSKIEWEFESHKNAKNGSLTPGDESIAAYGSAQLRVYPNNTTEKRFWPSVAYGRDSGVSEDRDGVTQYKFTDLEIKDMGYSNSKHYKKLNVDKDNKDRYTYVIPKDTGAIDSNGNYHTNFGNGSIEYGSIGTSGKFYFVVAAHSYAGTVKYKLKLTIYYK